MSSKSPKNPAKKTTKKASDAGSASAAASPASKAGSKAASKPVIAAAAPADIGDHHLVKMTQVMRASRALKTHITKLQEKAGSKAQLFSNVSPVTVEILLHKVPIKANNKRKPLPLVKPIRNNKTTEICVFARDSKVAKQKLQEASAPNISKVIDLKKLRTHYNQYEARRTLASSYDLFLVEDTILPDVCHQLGSSFLRIRKAPVAFKLNSLVSDQIVKIRDSTLFELSAGVTQSYRIGDTGFDEAELCQNFASSIDAAIKLIPLGWSNVKQIALISTGCAPLPVYNNLVVPTKSDGVVEDGKTATKAETKKETPVKGKRAAPAPVEAEDEEEEAAAAPAKKKKAAASENGSATPKKVVAEKETATPSKKAATTPAKATTPKAKAAATPKEETPKKETPKKETATPKKAATPAKEDKKVATPKSAKKATTPAKETPSKASVTAKSPKSASKKK